MFDKPTLINHNFINDEYTKINIGNIQPVIRWSDNSPIVEMAKAIKESIDDDGHYKTVLFLNCIDDDIHEIYIILGLCDTIILERCGDKCTSEVIKKNCTQLCREIVDDYESNKSEWNRMGCLSIEEVREQTKEIKSAISEMEKAVWNLYL